MSDTEVEEVGRQTVPFADTLQKLRRGQTVRELADALQELIEAVEVTHLPGSLTLTIKVAKSKASGMLEVTDEYRVKKPQEKRAATLLFVTKDMNLSTRDPLQDELPLGPVRIADDPKPTAAVSE